MLSPARLRRMKTSDKCCLCLTMLLCGSLVFPLETGQQCLPPCFPPLHVCRGPEGAGLPGLVRNERFWKWTGALSQTVAETPAHQCGLLRRAPSALSQSSLGVPCLLVCVLKLQLPTGLTVKLLEIYGQNVHFLLSEVVFFICFINWIF